MSKVWQIEVFIDILDLSRLLSFTHNVSDGNFIEDFAMSSHFYRSGCLLKEKRKCGWEVLKQPKLLLARSCEL